MNAIELQKLTKFYGPTLGVVDLELQVEEGEFFGFIGPNGAGKSTTIRTLLGLLRPTEGFARVFGLDVQQDRTEILAQTGYLPAEARFYSGMRVRDVLKLSADLRHQDCRQAAKELCSRLQLDPDRRVDQLSFGNRKKVGIICALQHNPRLLLLDEPTTGLDPLMQKAFFDILEERNRAGTTVFLSSHVLSEVQDHCRRAAVIRKGSIIACDRMETLARTSARRISLRGSVGLTGLAGVRDEKLDGQEHSFLYSGDMDALLRRLAEGHVEELRITEPSLEEVFLHYYEEGAEQHDHHKA